jgi:hypothetical protein
MIDQHCEFRLRPVPRESGAFDSFKQLRCRTAGRGVVPGPPVRLAPSATALARQALLAASACASTCSWIQHAVQV